MTAASFAKKFHSIGACPEGRDWILAGNHDDFRTTWRLCPAGEFLCWVATRLLGLEGTRAAVSVAGAAGRLYSEPLLAPTIALCELIIAGKAGIPGPALDASINKLQALAYDCTAAALGNRKGNGEALLAASYAAYAVAFAAMAIGADRSAAVGVSASASDEKKRMIAKAAQHASDAAVHAWEAMPGRNAQLVNLVRDAVKEDAVVRAWAVIPEPR